MSGNFKPNLGRFGASTDEEIAEILQERNAVNTNKATKSCIRILNDYITEKHLPKLEETGDADLPALLKEFYVNARQKKNNDLYHTQTMKNIRSGFQENRKVNIINDDQFNEANMIFKGVQVHAKKADRGSRHHTPPITDEDMERLALYFNIDQVRRPNPSIIQRNVIFNIIYYLCRRGQENLYEMTKDWFKVKGAKGKKGKKNKESNTNKSLDSITCNICKTIFTDEESKILCCDRCELWFCTSCANVTNAGYMFLSSKEAEDVAWYCKSCKLQAKNAVLEDKSIEDKCKEYTKELNLKMMEVNMSCKSEMS